MWLSHGQFDDSATSAHSGGLALPSWQSLVNLAWRKGPEGAGEGPEQGSQRYGSQKLQEHRSVC